MDSAASPDVPVGIAFVEYAAAHPEALGQAFVRMGFATDGLDPHSSATRYVQGAVTVLVNPRPDGFGPTYARQYGAGICGVGLHVANAKVAWQHAVDHGAQDASATARAVGVTRALAVYGIGGTLVYFLDAPAAAPAPAAPAGLQRIDHLSCQVAAARIDEWVGFLTQALGLRERTQDASVAPHPDRAITRVLDAADGRACIALTPVAAEEDLPDGRDGERIRHLTLESDDLYASVEALRAAGVPFLDTPAAYYDLLDTRLPAHGEDVARLARNGILVDSSVDGGVLLQIFTGALADDLFVELVQRKGDRGFGQGNFEALFESIALDQQRGSR